MQEDEDLENNEDIRNFVNSVIQEVNLIFDGQMDFKFSVNSLEVGDGSTDWEEPFKELECGKLPESKTDKLFDLLKDGELGREGSWHVFGENSWPLLTYECFAHSHVRSPRCL